VPEHMWIKVGKRPPPESASAAAAAAAAASPHAPAVATPRAPSKAMASSGSSSAGSARGVYHLPLQSAPSSSAAAKSKQQQPQSHLSPHFNKSGGSSSIGRESGGSAGEKRKHDAVMTNLFGENVDMDAEEENDPRAGSRQRRSE